MCRLVRIRAGSLVAVLLTLTAALQPSPCTRRTLTRRHGFFDVLSDAFANDETVSKLDYGDNAPAAAAQPLSEKAGPLPGLFFCRLDLRCDNRRVRLGSER